MMSVQGSIENTTPLCSVFEKCGGCQYQNLTYSKELLTKQQIIQNLFSDNLDIDSELIDPIVASPKEYHYRNRLDLRLLRDKEKKVEIGFSPTDKFGVVEVEECPIAIEAISDFIPQLKVEAIPILPKKYRMANLVVRCGDANEVKWGGIGQGSLLVEESDYFYTRINGLKIFYSLDTFFQANLSILPLLFEKIKSFDMWSDKTVFFDLYGGVGFFSLGLQGKYQQSFLIENSKNSIKIARYNVLHHGIENITVVEGKVEEHFETIISGHRGTKVGMIDPPRAGLTPTARELLSQTTGIDFLFYLSCNPESLVADLKCLLKHGWVIMNVTPYDFFPKTKHIETLVLLNRT